jgi:hypothetical protein
MFAWAPIPEQVPHLGSLEFSKLLIEKADFAVAPGVGFGEHGDEYVRIALVENKDRIRQAARNLRRFLETADETLHNVVALSASRLTHLVERAGAARLRDAPIRRPAWILNPHDLTIQRQPIARGRCRTGHRWSGARPPSAHALRNVLSAEGARPLAADRRIGTRSAPRTAASMRLRSTFHANAKTLGRRSACGCRRRTDRRR